MMRTSQALLPSAALVATALVLTGCSGNGGGAELEWEDSPLSPYLNAGYDMSKTDDEWAREAEENNKKVEELVAACMADEGFEYDPTVAEVEYSSGEDEEWNPDDREWVAQWGFGMVDWPGREAAESISEDDIPVDPNADYLATLSESEQQAYNETLWGPQPTEEEMSDPDFEWEYDPENAGCYGTASEEIWTDSGPDLATLEEEFADLFAALDTFYSEQTGEEPLEVDGKWSSCMADAGYPDIERQWEASNVIAEKHNAIYEAMDQEQAAEDPDFTDPNKNPELKALKDEEIEMALADFDCRKEVNYEQESLKEQFALEEQFVAEHKAELEAYKAAAEQAG